MKPRLRAEELTGMISLLRDKFVRSENLRRCCFVPMRRNSVLDGLRSNLFKFIQERMSVKVVVSVSRHRAELVGVKEMYSWVSSAYKWYLREFFEITEPRGVVLRVKRSGPSTEPWGTPQERVENAEMESLIETA